MWLGCALRPIGCTRLQRSAPQFTRCVQAGVPLQTCLFLSSKLNFIWSFGKTFTPKKEKLQEADGERGRGCSKRNDNLIATTLHWLGACWGNLLCQALSIEARLSERTKRFTFFYVKETKKNDRRSWFPSKAKRSSAAALRSPATAPTQRIIISQEIESFMMSPG